MAFAKAGVAVEQILETAIRVKLLVQIVGTWSARVKVKYTAME